MRASAWLSLSGRVSVGLSDTADGARRKGPGDASDRGDRPETPRDLQAILAMSDPRQALIALTGVAFAAAARAHGLHLSRAWTLRDALRRMPRDWRHLSALSDLARAAELAHFGGRDVSAAEFEAHLAAIRPVLGVRA